MDNKTNIKFQWLLLGLFSGLLGTLISTLISGRSPIQSLVESTEPLETDPLLVSVVVLGLSFALVWGFYEFSKNVFDLRKLLGTIIWTPLAYFIAVYVAVQVWLGFDASAFPTLEPSDYLAIYGLGSLVGSVLMLLAATRFV